MSTDPSRVFARAIRGAWQCRLWARTSARGARAWRRSLAWRWICIVAVSVALGLSLHWVLAQFIKPSPILHISDAREAPGCP